MPRSAAQCLLRWPARSGSRPGEGIVDGAFSIWKTGAIIGEFGRYSLANYKAITFQNPVPVGPVNGAQEVWYIKRLSVQEQQTTPLASRTVREFPDCRPDLRDFGAAAAHGAKKDPARDRLSMCQTHCVT